MRLPKLLVIVTALTGMIALSSSCNRSYVALDFTNAKGEIPLLGNLVFRFDKSLVEDSLLNNWDSTEYITFQPAIPGRFRWEGTDQLVFSPSRPLAPATTYTAKISDNVLRYTKYDKVEIEEDVKFFTAPLQLLDAQVTWVLVDEVSRQAVPNISLHFNYNILPEEIKDKLVVEVSGKKTDYSLQTLSSSKEVVLRLNNFKGEDKSYEAKVIIEPGLVPQGGKNKTEEKIQTLLIIPSPYVLNINDVQSEHDGTEGIVRISTSQQLVNENITSHIKFEPAVNYTVEFNDFGLVLKSDKFSAEESYTIQISKGLKGRIGGILKEDYYGSVAFGQMEAGIKFTSSKAVYLSKRGGGNIEVRVSNVPKLKLIISKIYENNLLMVERYGYTPTDDNKDARYASYEEEYEEGYYDYNESMAGDVVYSKIIDTRSLPKSGSARILSISQFEDRLPEVKGIYHVMLRSVDDYWVRDSRFISFSDIGLITKQGQDKMMVFANSIKSANGIEGATINVYGKNNQLIGTGATNKDGVAEVELSRKNISGFTPAMIIAKTADDFTYLPFKNTRVNTSRFEVGGKRNNATGLDAFIYAERDIYRPGETVNFAVLLRNLKWKSPGEIPILLKFLLPNGKEHKVFRKTLNPQGGTEASIDISSAAITGSYTLEVYSSNEILLASKNFMIEEFVPDRIKVTTKLNKPFLIPGDKANLSINAINFFGPPAANRNYEIEIQVKQQQFNAKNFPDFDFTLDNQRSFADKEVKEGKTDAGGNAVEMYNVPDIYKNVGLLKASFFTTVFDETGRPVSRVSSADIYTQDVFHGVKSDEYYYYPLNQPVQFRLVSVNKDGVAVNATAKIKLVKHEYRTVLTRSGSYFRYDSQQEDKVMMEKDITIGNNTPFSYIPRSPGEYELRIYRPGSNAYVSKGFYSYGSWGADASSFEVNTEGHIDIEFNKQSFRSNEIAQVSFKCPFSGRMLVTVERDGVMSYQYVDVKNRFASLDIKLNGEHVPNIYVTATLIKPHEVSDIPLTVAHGFQSVKVIEPDRKIPVQIMAKQSSRSKQRQQVRIKASPNSYVSLAAVDNGVLQITGFETPDPFDYYYQKKALEVTVFDMYPLLFPELRSRMSSTGGDGDIDMSKRVNPMPAKRFKIMSYWSGMKKTDAGGNATFEFEIPQFNGQIRLMALAYKDENFGSAEAIMKVADPIVISTALPRFLSPSDTAVLPVTLTNTTARSASTEASISVKGPFKIVGNASERFTLNPNSEKQVIFKLIADPSIAVGKVTVTVNSLGERFSEENEIAVRPASTLQKLTGSGSIVGGTSQKISLPDNDFITSSRKFQLVVSKSPVAELSEQLRYLVQYPYGCTEQTISAAFPQLYYGDFADLLHSGESRKTTAITNVMEAIRIIKMRQLYNGAVMLWDGQGSEHWWTTVYAAHFLLEAKKAGYDVDNSLLETMLGYMINRLKTKETITYHYNRSENKKIAPKEVSYSLYVLALASRAQVSAMNYYRSNPQLLALDGKYLLSAAYAVAGDKKAFASFLPNSFSGEYSVQQTGGSFYSETRDEAIALNALMDVDPGNAQVPVMAKHVSDRLKKERYLNTQERAFSFLALGKIARTAARSNVSAEVRSNGKVIGTINGNDWKSGKNLEQGGNIEIITKGNGRLYYSWEMEGISSTGAYKLEDNFIKVRRTFYNRNGNLLPGETFKQNDLIIVRITLERFYDNSIENIVITDMLPAGFEIENPRTKEIPGMDWIKNASEPTALDVRDDRIHLFVDALSRKQTYYYAVRAISLGHFKQGPVSADAMYNGEIHSYHGAGIISVVNQ